MHHHDLNAWQRSHNYLGAGHDRNEGRTRLVMLLTAAMMVAEIAAGIAFGSMALLADGWHMASHAGALGISAFAYAYARRHQNSGKYSFGTGKVGDLAGFSSALVLAMVAALMAYESVVRLISPVSIAFDQAIAVAVLGLVVNLVSAWLLKDDHHHHHGHDHHDHEHHDDHDHDHDDHAHHHHADHNLRAAYLHVITDALTSVLAIAALVMGRFFGWTWMDPLMGIVGAIVIAKWAFGLMGDTGRVLLDATPDTKLTEAVRTAVEAEADNSVADLHVWRIGPGHHAAVLTVVTHHPRAPAHYKALVANVPGLSHITVEVETCPGETHRAA